MTEYPFTNTPNNTLYNKVKILFFIFSGIAIIRFILFILIGCITSLLFNIFLIGYNPKDKYGNFVNISIIRRTLLYIPQILIRIELFILGFYIFDENIDKIFKFNYLEKENTPKLIISNHVSFIDSFYFITRGIISPVAVYNVINMPLVGSIFKKLAPILIPTDKDQKEKINFASPKAQISERLTHPSIKTLNRPLIIFPEGSTKNSKYLLKFQEGAFNDKVVYQPILLNYDYKYFDPSWTLNSTDYILIFLMCCQFINKLEVIYLEPTNLPSNEIREIFISKLNLIDSKFSNHDNNLLKKNYDKMDYIINYIFQKDLYTMEYYRKFLILNSDDFSKIVNIFYDLDIDKKGFIKENQLYKFYEDIYINIINNQIFSKPLIILSNIKQYTFIDALKILLNK